MPISATGDRFRRHVDEGGDDAGFTLVELMVVLVIVGLASAAVVLAMPDPSGRVHDAAARLAARALAVRDDAIVEGRSTRLVIAPDGYSAERRASGHWQAYGDRVLGAVTLPSGVTAATGETGRQYVTFDATGATEPATVTLGKGSIVVRIDIPANGAARVAP